MAAGGSAPEFFTSMVGATIVTTLVVGLADALGPHLPFESDLNVRCGRPKTMWASAP